MDLQIVRMTAANAGLLDNVAEDVFDAPVDPARLAVYLAQPANLMMVAVEGGLVVGQAMAVVHHHPDKPDDLYIDEVGVSPHWQRRGIARRLMEATFDRGRELGCASCWLATETDNTAAQGLYRSLDKEGEAVVMFAFDL